jgi:5'-nucleotidase
MILLVNDDGIDSPYLRPFCQALRERCHQPVLTVTPVKESSGRSQAITLHRPLRARAHEEEGFFAITVDGTPADCLKLALRSLVPTTPLLVVSGINNGPNVGRSIFYSGTVGAAMEAAIEGYAAIAFSHEGLEEAYLTDVCIYAAKIVAACLTRGRLPGKVFNINLPSGSPASWPTLEPVSHGRSGWIENYEPQRTSDDRLLWQLRGTRHESPSEVDQDTGRLRAGVPTLTLLEPDCNLPATDLLGPLLRHLGNL